MNDARKKKVEAYVAELTALNEKYQFKLTPYIQYTPEGAFPRFTVEDAMPAPKKPEPPATPVEQKTVANETLPENATSEEVKVEDSKKTA